MHVNPALGGGLSGTLGNARVVPDAAELVLAQKVYGAKSAAAAASAAATPQFYLMLMSNGDIANPQVVFYEGDFVVTKVQTTST